MRNMGNLSLGAHSAGVEIEIKLPNAAQATEGEGHEDTNLLVSFSVTRVRILGAPPSVCPIRDRDSIDIANRALVARFCVLGPTNWS